MVQSLLWKTDVPFEIRVVRDTSRNFNRKRERKRKRCTRKECVTSHVRSCSLTWQKRDEISLQHRLEIRIDMPVLVMTHSRQQLLDEMHLLRLAPSFEELHTELLLLSVLRRHHRRRWLFLTDGVIKYSHRILQQREREVRVLAVEVKFNI